MDRVSVSSTTRGATRCPYCHGGIEELLHAQRCGLCGVAHHRECFSEHGRCSVFGCSPLTVAGHELAPGEGEHDWIYGLLVVIFFFSLGTLSTVVLNVWRL